MAVKQTSSVTGRVIVSSAGGMAGRRWPLMEQPGVFFSQHVAYSLIVDRLWM